MASSELDVADDIEASEYFNLAVLNNGVTLKVSEPLELTAELPPRRNLFALSNLFGLAVVATNNGFAVFTLATLRQAYKNAKQRTQALAEPLRSVVIGDGGLSFVKIGLRDKVVVASGPSLQGGIGVWRLKSLVDGTSTDPLHVFSPTANAPLVDVLPNPGDRPELLALLYQDGQIMMINMETKATVSIFGQGITAARWSVKGKQVVTGDQQGNLTQFTPEGEPKTVTEAPTSLRGRGMKVLDIRWVENTVFFVTYCDAENAMDTSVFVTTRGKDGSVTYSPILDPLMVETMDRPEARLNAWMKNWTPFKHLLFVCNSTSNTIGHVGLGPVGEGGSEIAWSSVKNDMYTTLPLETYSIGLDIDFTDITEPSAEENAGNKATPTLWSYSSDGSLSAWRIVNLQGEQYPSIAAPHDVVTEEDAGITSSNASANTQAPPPTAQTSTASPFAANPSAAGFGSSPFGSGTFSSPPSFGRAPSFGAPPSFAPAFGQATFGSPAAFGKPAFGQPALQPAAAPAKGAFSSFSAQPSAFASPSTSITPSPFASSSSSPSPTPAFASAQPAAFGTSTFGQPASASGTVSMATSPAPAAFGQPSPFGSSAASSTSPFASSKPATGGFGSFAASGDAKPTASGFGAFSSNASSTSSGFGFGSSTAESSKNAFGVASPSAFSGLRGDTTVSSTPAIKPPGLDENDAEDMEPVTTTSQQGGALEFGDGQASEDGDRGNALSFGGLGFGISKPAPSSNAAPSAFGGFSKPGASSSAIPITASTSTPDPSPFSFASKDTAQPKPAFGFSGFGQSIANKGTGAEKAAVDQESTPIKTPFSFAKAAEVKTETAEKITTIKEPALDFGKAAAASEDKKDSPASSSAFGGFGKVGAFGQGTSFGQTSTFGQSPAFGKSAFGTTPEKPAFSFSKPSSETKVSGGGFSSFASSSPSTSASPFASPPAQSPSITPAFGQPGLFKGFGQQTTSPSPATLSESVKEKPDTSKPAEADKKSESLAQPGSASSKSDALDQPGKTSGAGEQQETTSSSEASDVEESYADDVKEETFSQEEDWNEQEGDEVEQSYDEEDEEEEGYDEEASNDQSPGVSQDGQLIEPEIQANEEEGPGDSADEVNSTGTADEANEAIAMPSASSSPRGNDSEGSSSPPGSPSPAPTAKKLDIPAEAAPRSSFTPAKSAFSFAPAATSESSEPAKPSTPSWSFGEKQADQETPKAQSAPSNAFGGFGKPASAAPESSLKTSEDSSKKADAPQSAFGSLGQAGPKAASSQTGLFGFSQAGKAADSPKPFGLGNLQKATPRTSSPLASMPAFAPPASPSQTQSSFDLSNLSSAPSSPIASPTKASQQPPTSTTPQGKMPSSSFFKQPENKPLAVPQPVKPSPPPMLSAPLSRQSSNTAAQTISAPPKLSSSVPKERQKPQVSQDTLNIFLTMQDHIDALKESAAACMAFFHSVQPARLPKEQLSHPIDVLDYDMQWGMGDLPRLREATRSLSKTLAEVSHQAKDEEKAARSLEGSLLKTKAKAEEINRYLRAREDPQVAKMVRVRQLGPEQLENQTRIRKQTQNVNEALTELERTIISLKEKVLEEKLGRSPMQAPSLDSIYRAIRNLTAGLQNKVVALDDIALRLDMMTLTTDTPTKPKGSTPKGRMLIGAASQSPSGNGSPSRSSVDRSFSHAPKKDAKRTASRIERNVRSTLAAEEFGQKLKEAWLAKHKEPLLNTEVSKASH